VKQTKKQQQSAMKKGQRRLAVQQTKVRAAAARGGKYVGT
jgi:ribosomal protein L44E